MTDVQNITTAMARSTASVMSTRSRDSMRKISNSRSKDQVRSRLLNNLGIFNNGGKDKDKAPNPAIARKIKIIRAMGLGGVIPPKPASQTSSSQIIDNENIRPKINFSQITHEPLKYKEDDTDIVVAVESEAMSTTETEAAADTNDTGCEKKGKKQEQKPQRRKICFNDSVSVAHIPMRSEYSDRVRSRIWSNRYEIHENATRNAIEFQAEGWDWRTTIEDEGMFVCTSSGELIHPVHCQQQIFTTTRSTQRRRR